MSFTSLSFLIDSHVICFILNSLVGSLLYLVWFASNFNLDMWSLILKVVFGKEHCPVLNHIFLYCFVWNAFECHVALERGCHRDR